MARAAQKPAERKQLIDNLALQFFPVISHGTPQPRVAGTNDYARCVIPFSPVLRHGAVASATKYIGFSGQATAKFRVNRLPAGLDASLTNPRTKKQKKR